MEVSNAIEAGAPKREIILIVDDEPHIIKALKRLLADNDYEVLSANDAEEGLALVRSNNVNVVLSDYCMPGRNGIDFLSQVKLVSPKTERVLMTAYATIETAIQAINSGEVFRFVVKPWHNASLLNSIEDCLMHQRLLTTLKLGEERMFHTMARMVELKDPYTRGHCQRVAESSVAVAGILGLTKAVQKEVRWGGWLHDCGKVGVPEKVLNFPGKLSEEDMGFIHKHPEWGASVVSEAGLSQYVVNIVLYHHEYFGGGGYPIGLQGEGIPIEARIVAVSDVFDALSTDRPYRKGFSLDKVRQIMYEMSGVELDPELVETYFAHFDTIQEAIFPAVDPPGSAPKAIRRDQA
jgi:putative nucleotidyltransferase with HDIG domain